MYTKKFYGFFFNVLCKVSLLWSYFGKLPQQCEVRIPSGWCQVPFEIYSGEEVECKPFKNRHIDQLDLVKSLDWLVLSKLDDVDQIIERAFSDPQAANFIDEKSYLKNYFKNK